MSFQISDLFPDGKTPLFLAPQAGVSEEPFRRLCKRFGADVVVSEFVSADGIVRGNPKSDRLLRFNEAERPIGIQLFGSDPTMLAEATRMVTEVYGPDFVDLNFGCPAKKIVRRNGGSGCLRDLNLVESIVRAVVDATHLPVTTKIRSGYDERTRDPVEIGLRCQGAGSRMVTLHPRTRSDMYSGVARWEEIAALVEALEVPVVGNGDVKNGDDALRMKEETGCDGIMIARGSHGDPWIFTQARAALDGNPIPQPPGVEERLHICLEHARNAIEFESDHRKGVIEFRKHLGWYTKGFPGGRALRTELFKVETLAEIERRLEAFLLDWRLRQAEGIQESVAG